MRVEEVFYGVGQQQDIENHRVPLLVGQEGKRAKERSMKLKEAVFDIPMSFLDEVGQKVGLELAQERQPRDRPENP